MKTITATLVEALEPFILKHDATADHIGDSDLYPEQPRAISVTLGDIRRGRRALQAFEALKTSPNWTPYVPQKGEPDL